MDDLLKNLRAMADAPGHAADICSQAADEILMLRDAVLAARSVINHWHEFGPEHGFQEAMELLRSRCAALDGADKGGRMHPKLTNAELDALSAGNFYKYMMNQDHREWARQANRIGQLGLSQHAEDLLAGWFANAMCAVDDRRSMQIIAAQDRGA